MDLTLTLFAENKESAGEALIRRVVADYERIAESNPESTKYRDALLEGRLQLGAILIVQLKLAEAEALLLRIKAGINDPSSSPQSHTSRRYLASLHYRLGTAYRYCDDFGKANDHLERARVLQARLVGEDPEDPDLRSSLAATHSGLAATLQKLSRSEDAEGHSRTAIELSEGLVNVYPGRQLLPGNSCATLERRRRTADGVRSGGIRPGSI